MAKNVILWFFGLCYATDAWAQHSAPDTLVALMVDQKLTLDGKLDEPARRKAVKITNFTQRELAYGQPVTERTEVAVLYDDRTLYIGGPVLRPRAGADHCPRNETGLRIQQG